MSDSPFGSDADELTVTVVPDLPVDGVINVLLTVGLVDVPVHGPVRVEVVSHGENVTFVLTVLPVPTGFEALVGPFAAPHQLHVASSSGVASFCTVDAEPVYPVIEFRLR